MYLEHFSFCIKEHRSIHKTKEEAHSYLRSKRSVNVGIVCECCLHRCTISELNEYCPSERAERSVRKRRRRSSEPRNVIQQRYNDIQQGYNNIQQGYNDIQQGYNDIKRQQLQTLKRAQKDDEHRINKIMKWKQLQSISKLEQRHSSGERGKRKTWYQLQPVRRRN